LRKTSKKSEYTSVGKMADGLAGEIYMRCISNKDIH